MHARLTAARTSKEAKMRKFLSIILALALIAGFAAPARAADRAALDKAINDTAAYMLKTVKTPEVGSVGGEWVVIGLARSGYGVPDSYYENYYKTVEKYVKDNKGVLHDIKYTEYSRVILGLTAAGYDPRDVAGYDLTEALSDFDRTITQGINGPVWALIALDSLNYPSDRRDSYIAEILRRQLDDGGWNLGGGASADTKGQKSDPDITGMALQALAKYQGRPEVKAATERALACMSEAQDAKGGYYSDMSGDAAGVESAVQVLVALCELGIPADDPRFVKNGYTLVDSILSFRNADGSFMHTAGSPGDSQMSTEQAFYGLVAAWRAAEGKDSLYRMADAEKRGEFKPIPPGSGLPGRHADVKQVPVTRPGTMFADVAAHKSRAAIEALAARGIINGVGDGAFSPDGLVTRAEFAKMVTFSLGLPERADSPFADVPAGQWYSGPIATACHYGIANGVGSGEFNPNGTITRQEAAAMTARAARLAGMDTDMDEAAIRDALAQFGDYRTAADWAQAPLAFCYAEGILDDSALDIEPGRAASRAEIADMMYRMLDKAELL
jgi:hypothetical protein